MAAPAISAAALLVRQYFQDGWYPSGAPVTADVRTPTAALVKAMLLNGAVDMSEKGYGGPKEGFGFPLLDNVLFFSGDPRGLKVWDVPNAAGLRADDETTYTVKVAAGQPLRVTLAWTDPVNAMAADPRISSDLNLTVATSGDEWLGNVFGTKNNITQSQPGGSFDLLNNVELVVRAAPPAGDVEITVRRRKLGRPDPQGYALVVTGALVP
jgi:hypothetical protein